MSDEDPSSTDRRRRPRIDVADPCVVGVLHRDNNHRCPTQFMTTSTLGPTSVTYSEGSEDGDMPDRLNHGPAGEHARTMAGLLPSARARAGFELIDVSAARWLASRSNDKARRSRRARRRRGQGGQRWRLRVARAHLELSSARFIPRSRGALGSTCAHGHAAHAQAPHGARLGFPPHDQRWYESSTRGAGERIGLGRRSVASI